MVSESSTGPELKRKVVYVRVCPATQTVEIKIICKAAKARVEKTALCKDPACQYGVGYLPAYILRPFWKITRAAGKQFLKLCCDGGVCLG